MFQKSWICFGQRRRSLGQPDWYRAYQDLHGLIMFHCGSDLFDSCISDGGVVDLEDSNFFAEVTGGQSLVHPNAVFQVMYW